MRLDLRGLRPYGSNATTSVVEPATNEPATEGKADRCPRASLPVWLEGFLVVALCAFIAYGVVGIALAMVGWFRPLPLFLATLTLTVVLLRLWRARFRLHPRGAHLPSILAVAFCLAFAGLQAAYSAEHLLVERDPGVYVTTARHLAETGDLVVDLRAAPFLADPAANFQAPGYHQDGTRGVLYPQFLHLLPVLMAPGAWVEEGLLSLKIPALLGGFALLLFYALACRIVRPWLALGGTIALGVNPAYVHFSRDAYSEIPTMVCLFGGLWLLWSAREQLDPRRGLVAGTLLGMAGMTRIDGYVYFIPFLAYLLVEWHQLRAGARLLLPKPPRHFLLALFAGAMATTGLGLLDLFLRSPFYASELSNKLELIGTTVLAVSAGGLVILLVVWQLPRLAEVMAARRRAIAATAAILVVGVSLLATFARPAIQEMHRPDSAPFVVEIEKLEGLPLDGTRLYFEETALRLSWYVGVVSLVAGIVGLGLVVRQVLLGQRRGLLPFLLLFLTISAVYIWNAQIDPDQIWAMRRYLPLTIPGIVLLAMVAADTLFDARAWRRSMALLGPAAGTAVLVAAIALPALALWPIAGERHQIGTLSVVDRVCERIGPRSALAIMTDRKLFLGPAVNAFCGTPVAYLPPRTAPRSLTDMAHRWREHGNELFVAAGDATTLATALSGAQVTQIATDTESLELTLEHRPDEIIERRYALVIAPASPGPPEIQREARDPD